MPDSDFGPYVKVRSGNGGTTPVCPEMVAAVERAYELAGEADKLVWIKGGLQPWTGVSAATHGGLCVADLRTRNMSDAQVWKVAGWLLRCGVIANIRGVKDTMDPHLHCMMANPVHAHSSAQAQVKEYRAGGDGLVGERPYWGPKVAFTTWEDSPHHPDNAKDAWDMASPDDVWKTDVDPAKTKQSSGKVLWGILQKVNALPKTLLRTKVGTRELNGWTFGHLIEWNARATRAQGEVLTQVTLALGQLAAGQHVGLNDLAAVQARLDALLAEQPPPDEPDEPEPPSGSPA